MFRRGNEEVPRKSRRKESDGIIEGAGGTVVSGFFEKLLIFIGKGI